MSTMFERFTDKARATLTLAQAEAGALGHNFLGTEHLLLGLLQTDGVAARVLAAEGLTPVGVRDEIRVIVGSGPGTDADALRSIGIDLDEVRAAVEESFGPGALDRPVRSGKRKRSWSSGPAYAPRMKKVLELSLREALDLGHGYIGTEHLLLAVVREGAGVAAQILVRHTDLSTLRPKVLAELSRLRPGA
jgi:ATP-dependent Clp protease ATP-binding subunit ClpA